MTPLARHTRYVEVMPHDRTAALALVDHYQEAHNWTRYQALMWVARITVAAKRAKRLAVAARWLAHRGDVGRYLRREIFRVVEFPPNMNVMRVLVGGFRVPFLTWHPSGPSRAHRWRAAVSVSAGWVILRVAEWFNPACNGAAIQIAKFGPKRLNKSENEAIARKLK